MKKPGGDGQIDLDDDDINDTAGLESELANLGFNDNDEEFKGFIDNKSAAKKRKLTIEEEQELRGT